jgi:hypothetical protein
MTEKSLRNILQRTWTRLHHHLFPPACARPGCGAPRTPRILRRFRPIKIQGRWLCSPRCIEMELQEIFERITVVKPSRALTNRVPLGLLMLSRGYVDERQLQTALEAQREAGWGKIGEWMRTLHYVDERQVLAALSAQWAWPVLAINIALQPCAHPPLPWPLLHDLGVMPVRFFAANRLLYIAASSRVEYSALAAIEFMADCQVIPCLVSDHDMQGMLKRAALAGSVPPQVFCGASDAAEMARIAGSYIARVGAKQARIVGCGPYAWVRLTAGAQPTDLLFALEASRADRDKSGRNFENALEHAS